MILRRKDERSIVHRDPAPGSLQQETPVRILDLACEVARLAPREPVVATLDQHELSGFFWRESGSGTVPASIAVTPNCDHEDRAGLAIDEHGGITDPVAAPLVLVRTAHIHDELLRSP